MVRKRVGIRGAARASQDGVTDSPQGRNHGLLERTHSLAKVLQASPDEALLKVSRCAMNSARRFVRALTGSVQVQLIGTVSPRLPLSAKQRMIHSCRRSQRCQLMIIKTGVCG